MTINFFSKRLLLIFNVCCVFAAEKHNHETHGKLSPLSQRIRKEATEEEKIRTILNDHPNVRVVLGGVKQVKTTKEMIHGTDMAGKIHEEWLKKNPLQNEQLSSEDDDICCTVTLKFKW